MVALKIVFLDRDTLAPSTDLRKPDFENTWKNYASTSQEKVVERLQGCDIAVLNKVELREAQLQCLPQLKMIAIAATGMNVVDLDYCSARGITVANVRHYARHSVPEHALALIILLRRNIFSYYKSVCEGQWQRSEHFCFFNQPIHDLAGSRLGIIGGGVLGQAMASLGRALGMDVVIASRKGEVYQKPGLTSFEQVLSSSDVLSLHCPLNSETENLISLDEFKKMKKTSLLINTARGGIVNENDLVLALRDGLIAGAGFDVLTQEPPRADHPLLALTDLPNFILTPHIGWASEQAMQTLADQLIDNIEAFVKTQ